MKLQKARKLLFPFSIAYQGITSLRNKLYDQGVLGSKKFDLPTIVVGNLSVGGTGKTPMIEYLIRLLSEKYRVAVLSRGYKRKTKGFLLAGKDTDSSMIGDEPFQYHSKFKNINVAVDADRVNGIEQLLQLVNKPELVLLDDAFQHRRLEGGLNVLLTTYHHLFTRDLLLPAGNLREGASGANRADIIVVTKCPADLNKSEQQKVIQELKPTENQQVFFTKISYGEFLQGHSKISLAALEDYEILLFTGIANAKPLLDFLGERNLKFKHLEFPDHHNYTTTDLAKIKATFESLSASNKLLLTTEKDYARCAENFPELHYLTIECEFVSQKTAFDTAVLGYISSNVSI